MVQGDNPLEVNTESDDEDVDMSYDELATFCHLVLEKYDMIKKKNKNLKKELDCMHVEHDSFRSNIACLEKDNKILKKNFDAMLNDKDSLENKMACLEKENEDLKNENISLMSKLNVLCEGNMILKNKIDLVEKQKEDVFQENKSLKRKICEKEKDFVSQKKKKSDSISHHASHAHIDQNEIKNLKNKIDNLSSNLSSCAFNHTRLESLFQKKQVPHTHAHSHHAHAYDAHHAHTPTHKYAKVYICTHCGRKGHLRKFCYERLNVLIFDKNKNAWVPYKTNPIGPKKIWVPKSPPCVFDVGEESLKT